MKTKLLLLFALLTITINAQSIASTTVYVGSPMEITAAAATGTAPFTFTWTKNGAAWTPPVAPVISTDGMKAAITIPSAQLTDSGNYAVKISNSAGATSSPSASATIAQVIVLPGNVSITIIAK